MNTELKVPEDSVVPVALTIMALLGAGLLWWWGMQDPADPALAARTPAARGRALATAQGCIACHTLDGAAGIGPSWQGSFGSVRTFSDGATAVVNEEYLYSAMRQPAAQVVAGYQNVMLPAALTDAQIADIIELIRELSPSARP